MGIIISSQFQLRLRGFVPQPSVHISLLLNGLKVSLDGGGDFATPALSDGW